MEKRYDVPFWQLLVIGLNSSTDTSPLHGGSHIWGNFKINEKVDFEKFKKAINHFIEKNDSIRTKFCYENGTIKQYFAKYEPFDFTIIDVKDDEEVDKILKEMNSKFFEMVESYMFDIKLYRYPNGNGGVLLKVHHVIADGWSIGLAAYEVINEYIGKFVVPITGSFGDYLESRDNYEKSFRKPIDKKYWEELLKDGVPAAVTFPASKKYDKSMVYWDADKYSYSIDLKTIKKIEKYCEKNKISKSSFYSAVLAILLRKVSGSRKFMMNTMCSNRKNIKERFTTGMFTSMTYYLAEVPNIEFKQLVKNVGNSISAGFKHREYFDRYMSDVIKKVDPNRIGPLTSVIFSYQNLNLKTDKKDLDYEIKGDNNPSTASLDIAIHVLELESSNQVNLIYDYLTDKYDENDMKKINSQMLEIINQVVTKDEIFVDDINIER